MGILALVNSGEYYSSTFLSFWTVSQKRLKILDLNHHRLLVIQNMHIYNLSSSLLSLLSVIYPNLIDLNAKSKTLRCFRFIHRLYRQLETKAQMKSE